MKNVKNFISLVKETFQDWSEDKAPRLAAALAYYTVFSLAPLLILVIAITSFIVGNNVDIRTRLLDQVQGLVGPQAAEAVNTMIDNNTQPGSGIIATILGIGTLLLGATGLFGQLKDALNTIWEVQPAKSGGVMSIIKDRFLSFTMVLGISFLLLVSLVISAAISAINGILNNLLGGAGFIIQIVNFLISTGVVTLIFAMIFKILPDVDIQWKDVWVGALVTALLFNIGKTLIGLYLGNSATASAYGAAGSLVVLLLWVYYSAQILFLGAEFTQVYARRFGSKVLPAEGAVPMTAEQRARQGMAPQKGVAAGTTGEVRPVMGANVQQSMIPVAGQPEIMRQELGINPRRTRVRYEPQQPGKVVPVIAFGALSAVYTVRRIIRHLGRPAANHQIQRKRTRLLSSPSEWTWPSMRR